MRISHPNYLKGPKGKSVRALLTVSVLHFALLGSGQSFQPIDNMIREAIENRAFPGCVLLVAQKGVPVFHKAYGFHTYDSTIRVHRQTLYDLASITKVAAGTLAMMRLYEEGHIQLDDRIGDHFPRAKNKKHLTFRSILAHQSGMASWLNFYQQLLDKRIIREIRKGEVVSNDLRIGSTHYFHKPTYPTIRKEIMKSEKGSRVYKYSGLFFYLIPELVEQKTGMNIAEYLQKTYRTIGANSLCFNPTPRYSPTRIAPTEYDSLYRNQLVHGSVHDEGAATMGGISTNAGLFGTAMDLARLFQLFLNQGKWRGQALLQKETIELFTAVQYPSNKNRRALGFDKPPLNGSSLSYVAQSASFRSYGHSGFTGTVAWADPENDLIFVFLSNRVYPARSQTELISSALRQRLHDWFYAYLR